MEIEGVARTIQCNGVCDVICYVVFHWVQRYKARVRKPRSYSSVPYKRCPHRLYGSDTKGHEVSIKKGKETGNGMGGGKGRDGVKDRENRDRRSIVGTRG